MSEEATSEQSQTPPVAESSPTPESVASSQAPTTVESLEGERPSPQLAKPPVDQSDAKSEKSDTPTVDAEAQKRIKELEAMISDLKENITDTSEQVNVHKKAMLDSVLDNLQVLPKYRSFAPDVDPFTEAGKQELEKWAMDNPELLSSRPQQTIKVDTEAVKKGMKSPHLVDFSTFAKSLKGGSR